MKVTLEALSEEGLDDFLALHDRRCFGGCYCAVWSAFGADWGERCQARTPNRQHLIERVEAGQHRGFLVRSELGTAWTGAGRRRCFAGMEDRAGARSHPNAPDDWVIGCLALPPEARGAGLAHAVVDALVTRATLDGAGCIDAFPVRPWDEPRAYRGSERLYRAHGFVEVGSERVGTTEVVVMRRRL